MITPHLERLVWEGKAQYRNTVIGLSGVNVIEVPDNSFIIITDFLYNNFLDVDDFADIETAYQRSVHQVNFQSNYSQTHFIVRDDVRQTQLFAPPSRTMDVLGQVKFETYMVHPDEVTISIIHAPPLPFVNSEISPPPAALSAQPLPVGYGDPTSGVAQPQKITSPTTLETFLPLTQALTSPVAVGTPFNNLQFGVTPVTALNFLSTEFPQARAQRSYPIINVGYYLISEPITNHIKPSKS